MDRLAGRRPGRGDRFLPLRLPMPHDGHIARRQGGEWVRDDRGDVLVSGLLKLVAFLLALALVVFEIVAIAVNYVQLDDIAGQAVRGGASVTQRERTEAHVERAVLAVLDEHEGARLEDLRMNRQSLEITVGRQARVLVLNRLGPLGDLADNSLTKRAEFR
jgi:hypothetical protein